MNTSNKLEAPEGEGIANPLCIPSTSTSEHSDYSKAYNGEESIHPSVPKLRMQTGPSGAGKGGAALAVTGECPLSLGTMRSPVLPELMVCQLLQLHTFICFQQMIPPMYLQTKALELLPWLPFLCATWIVSCSGQLWLLAGNICSALAERSPAVSMVSCQTCTGAGLLEGRAPLS